MEKKRQWNEINCSEWDDTCSLESLQLYKKRESGVILKSTMFGEEDNEEVGDKSCFSQINFPSLLERTNTQPLEEEIIIRLESDEK